MKRSELSKLDTTACEPRPIAFWAEAACPSMMQSSTGIPRCSPVAKPALKQSPQPHVQTISTSNAGMSHPLPSALLSIAPSAPRVRTTAPTPFPRRNAEMSSKSASPESAAASSSEGMK